MLCTLLISLILRPSRSCLTGRGRVGLVVRRDALGALDRLLERAEGDESLSRGEGAAQAGVLDERRPPRGEVAARAVAEPKWQVSPAVQYAVTCRRGRRQSFVAMLPCARHGEPGFGRRAMRFRTPSPSMTSIVSVQWHMDIHPHSERLSPPRRYEIIRPLSKIFSKHMN